MCIWVGGRGLEIAVATVLVLYWGMDLKSHCLHSQLIPCVTLNKSFNLSEPLFPFLIIMVTIAATIRLSNVQPQLTGMKIDDGVSQPVP